jgi:hypothetical protein
LVEGGESATIRALMPQLCATKFFSIIANYLFSMTLPERASGLMYRTTLRTPRAEKRL